MSLGQAKPEIYQEQLQKKIKLTEEQFAEFNLPKIDVFESPPSHFRMRAEFKIWQEDQTAHYAMYEPGKYKQPLKIQEFSIGSLSITQLMPELLQRINENDVLRLRLFQAEFLTTTTGQTLVTLIYHKQLDDEWCEAAKALGKHLNTDIIGRSKKQKITLGKDYVVESFVVDKHTYSYQQIESGFTQPNGHVCQHMLNWSVDTTKALSGDLLELYCGNGNFTLPLSKNFNHVLATEVSKTSVKSAIHNIAINNCKNISIVRMSSEEITQALNKEREFRRLKDINLDDFSFSTVFVDPPRAGLDDHTLNMVSDFKNILYVSCNPDTLYKNIKTLENTHNIVRFALFDQFPYTDHRECGVLLTRLD